MLAQGLALGVWHLLLLPWACEELQHPTSAHPLLRPGGRCFGNVRRKVFSVLGLKEIQQLSFHKLRWGGFLWLFC